MSELIFDVRSQRGHQLAVESELGTGSTFRIRIPGVAPAGEQAKNEAGPAPAAAPEKLPQHVLIVDDSPVNRAVLTAFLKKAGVVSIGHACDGAEALSKIDSAKKAGDPFDFVFSDLWMPNMNGIEFIGKLRADPRFVRLPIFALTADTEYRRDERGGLFTGVLLKPLTYDKLIEAFAAGAAASPKAD